MLGSPSNEIKESGSRALAPILHATGNITLTESGRIVMKEKNALTMASGSGIMRPVLSKLPFVGLALLAALSTIAFAQAGAGANPELQQKLMALKQASAENKQKLHQYQWVETTQITLKGEQKPERVSQCSYGPNGQVQKVPLGAPPQQSSGRDGRLKQRVIEKKTDEMKAYMQQVQSLLSMYVPPNPELMQQAFQKKNVSMNKTMGTNLVNLVFTNYAKQGDQMTIAFDSSTRKISTINVNTYMDNPKDAVTLAVQMASLPDGTNYAQQTVLNATAKQIQVTTTNANYAKLQ
jgi:hypothetical protein